MKRKLAPLVLAAFAATMVRDQKSHSQDLVEYALLAGFISLVAVLAYDQTPSGTINLFAGTVKGSVSGSLGETHGQSVIHVDLVKEADGNYHLVTTADVDGQTARLTLSDVKASHISANGCFIQPDVIP
jgi:hypothetical protein